MNLSLTRRLLAHALAVVLIASMAAGCGIFSPDESDGGGDGGGGGGGGGAVFAATPDLLMQNFAYAYNNLNYPVYRDLIHDDFLFYFAPADLDLAPDASGTYNAEQDRRSTEAMFSGQEGYDKREDRVVPGVATIDLILIPRDSEWVDGADDGAEFAGTVRRTYAIDMTVTYTQGDTRDKVDMLHRFYAIPVEKVVEGNTVTEYQLKAWVDTGLSSLE